MTIPLNILSYSALVQLGDGRVFMFEGTQPLNVGAAALPTTAQITTSLTAMNADLLNQMTVGTALNPALLFQDATQNTQG